MNRLQVADLEDALVFFGQFDQVVGLGQGGGDRLFHHDIDSMLQAGLGNLVVEGGRHRYGHRIDQGDQFAVIGKSASGALAGHQLCPFRVGIGHAHQFNIFHGRIFVGMKTSEITNSYDPNLHVLAHVCIRSFFLIRADCHDCCSNAEIGFLDSGYC